MVFHNNNLRHSLKLKSLLIHPIFLCLILAITTLITYQSATQCDFIWDDDYYITDNPTLKNIKGLKKIWYPFSGEKIYPVSVQYYPLVYTSFWFERALWGLNPFGYHLTNIILHALNAFLVFLILKKLSTSGAFIAALIFAIHPVHVESVAWISERKNVLSCFFYLLSFYFYLPLIVNDQKDNKKFHLLSLLFFLGALLSKSVTCTLPAIILLITWYRNKQITRQHITDLIPFFCLAILFAVITIFNEMYQAGASGEGWSHTFLERFIIAGKSFWFYLHKLLWPVKLTFIYPQWTIDSSSVWSYLFPLTALGIMFLAWFMRHRWGSFIFLCLSFYAISIFPALGFFNVYPMRFSYVADHFQYIASLGPIILISAMIAKKITSTEKTTANTLTTVLILTFAILSRLSSLQCLQYKNVETLWRETIKKNPTSWMALNNLGSALIDSEKIQEALKYLLRSKEIKSDNLEVHFNLGRVYEVKKDYTKAIDAYYTALKHKPSHLNTLKRLGVCLVASNQIREAVDIYNIALQYHPDNNDILKQLKTLKK